MPKWMEILIGVLAFLGMGGWFAPFLAKRFLAGTYAEEIERLSKHFSKHAEFDGLRKDLEAKVEGACKEAKQAQGIAQIANANADLALDSTGRLELEHRHFGDQLMREVLVPMQGFHTGQQKMAEQLAAQTALLERLMREWDNHQRRNG